MHIYLIPLIMLLSLCVLPVAYGGMEKAESAHAKGDYVTAYKETKALAEQGDSDAQHNLGVMYEKSQGVSQNYAEAANWYHKAAIQGHPDAQYRLGVLYHEGQGIRQNYGEAVKWYRTAAEQGNFNAQHALGTMYYKGEGVPQDFVQTHMWFDLAAAQGDSDALKYRDLVAAKMTSAQIAEAQRLAREWQPKSH